jgi:ribosomal protein S18 acetylase RimI-like enzyme
MSSAAEPLLLIDWDSDFFGKRIARLFYPDAFASEIEFARACRDRRFELVQACIDADDAQNAHQLERLGFEPVDLKLTMARRTPPQHRGLVPDPRIRRSEESDIPALRDVCHGSFNDVSRYRWRNTVSDEQLSRFYDLWLENGVRGRHDDFCCHYEEGGRVLGFTTLRVRVGEVGIGIIAVERQARGRGIADALMENVFAYAAGHQYHSVSSVTQGKNIPTQRLYRKHGMEVTLSERWYYKITGVIA